MPLTLRPRVRHTDAFYDGEWQLGKSRRGYRRDHWRGRRNSTAMVCASGMAVGLGVPHGKLQR